MYFFYIPYLNIKQLAKLYFFIAVVCRLLQVRDCLTNLVGYSGAYQFDTRLLLCEKGADRVHMIGQIPTLYSTVAPM